ncbi:CAP domain-containing protein [Schizophyllum commune]
MKFTIILASLLVGVNAVAIPDTDLSARELDSRATPSTEVAQWLKAHNDERAKHGAVALTWNQSLADSAQSWANGCNFAHSNSGQNLAATFTSQSGVPNNIPGAVQQWNNERPQYNATTYQGAGHWTQVVWKSTKTVGCAAHSCPPGTLGTKTTDPWKTLWYYVCNYSPPGNVYPQAKYYPANVQP